MADIVIDFDKFQFTREKFTFARKYELPIQKNDDYNLYCSTKLKSYASMTRDDFDLIDRLSTELEPYIFTANDINNCCQGIMNMQAFICEDFPEYVNDIIAQLIKQVSDELKKIVDKRNEIDEWWKKLKISIQCKTFYWKNWCVLPSVDYYSTQFSNNTITQTLKFKDTTFGTYTTVFLSNGNIEETIVITDPYDNTTVYNKTKTTVFNADGSIKETVIEN